MPLLSFSGCHRDFPNDFGLGAAIQLNAVTIILFVAIILSSSPKYRRHLATIIARSLHMTFILQCSNIPR